MIETQAVLGRVVISKAGRDRGRAFLITGIVDDAHVYLADGVMRKLARPKKKKLMHLRIEPVLAEGIAAKLESGTKVFDAEIRRSLMTLGYNSEEQEQEG